MSTTDPAIAAPSPAPATRAVLVEATSGGKPTTVALLSDWEYLERALQRLIAGWGRYIAEWEDKVVVHRQIWEQAECVRRLRERLVQFPGSGERILPLNLFRDRFPRLADLEDAYRRLWKLYVFVCDPDPQVRRFVQERAMAALPGARNALTV